MNTFKNSLFLLGSFINLGVAVNFSNVHSALGWLAATAAAAYIFFNELD